MDIQFMKDYYDLRYEETDGENQFVEMCIRDRSASEALQEIRGRNMEAEKEPATVQPEPAAPVQQIGRAHV